MAEDTYKLKIMGYYHRKIAKYAGSFPVSLTSAEIRRYYVSRGALVFVLFVAAYVVWLVLLFRCHRDSVLRMVVLFLLSVGSGLIVVRFAKLHLVELPQVLALRQHPDVSSALAGDPLLSESDIDDLCSGLLLYQFANHLLPGGATAEAIPFARPVVTYSTEQRNPDAVNIGVAKQVV